MRQPKLSQKNANSDSRQTKRILCKMSYTTHRMEFAFLSNSMMRYVKGYNTHPYKNIKSPCKIRIRLVWHNEYSILVEIIQSF